MRVIVIILLGVHLAYAGKHSLKYFYTGVSGDIDFPEFTAVGLVDDGQFMYFDSNIMKAVPKTEWIRQNEGADYWDRETQVLIGSRQVFKDNIQIAKERFNQSKSVYSLQFMYGCELDDDGTTRGYVEYGYDGEDFISLDKSTLTWTAANLQAVITKQKWEATGANANTWKGYLENKCIEWLRKYVSYGKDILERKVSPQVSLLQKDSSSPVTCHATGFYPSGVTISWQRNGHDHHEDVDLGELLPNEDGTFQKSSTLRVTPDERMNNEFSCVVEHQGETITEILKDDSFPIAIIVGVVAVVLLVVIVVVGFVLYRRNKASDHRISDRKKGQTPVNPCPDPGDNGSHSSSDSTSDIVSVCSSNGSDSSSADSTTALLQRQNKTVRN